MITCIFGRQGFGKSTLSQLYSNADNGCVFHVGYFLKHPEEYADYLSDEDIIFLLDLRSSIDELIVNGKLCLFSRADNLILSTLIAMAKKQNVYADGYPRTEVQAKVLYNMCLDENIDLVGINIEYDLDDALQNYISFYRQYTRDLQNQKLNPMEQVNRYRNKIDVFLNDTQRAISFFIEHRIPMNTLYIDKNHNIRNSRQIPFNRIINRNTSAENYATEFFFYPASVSDYAHFYKSCSINSYPIMVTITLINKCTDNCVGCFNASHNGNEYIDINTLEKLIDDLADHGTVAIKAAGREPTAYPYLDRFIKKCAERHIQSVIITSGANLDKWADILSTECDHLRISLNAFSEKSHSKFHRPSDSAISFNERLALVRKLSVERKKRNLTTGITFLIRDGNENELPQLIDYCKACGITYLRFSKINYFKNAHSRENEFINEMESLSSKPFYVKYHEQYSAATTSVSNPLFSCPALLSRCVIHANGEVVSCHSSNSLGACGLPSLYGNINHSSFQEIWLGNTRKSFIHKVTQEMQANFKQSGEYRCDSTDCCTSCKYSGFNHINRWIIQQGDNVVEDFWKGILF